MREGLDRSYLKRERSCVAVFVAFVSLAFAHFVHDTWIRWFALEQMAYSQAGAAGPPAKMYAPVAYRVAMPAVTRTVQGLLPAVPAATIFAGLDFVFLFATLWVLYQSTVDGCSTAVEERVGRGLRIALMFLLCVVSLAWLVQYQRQETMPSAMYVAVSLYCMRSRGRWPVVALMGIAAVQAFVRSDVPFCLGLGMVLAALMAAPGGERAERVRVGAQGMAVALIAVGVQGYLQLVRFPHLSYDPNTPVLQLPMNLQTHMWGNALVALLPTWLPIGYCLVSRRRWLRSYAEWAAVTAGAVYFFLWITVGSLAEVRVYLPFLLGLSVVGARAIPAVLGWEPADSREMAGQ